MNSTEIKYNEIVIDVMCERSVTIRFPEETMTDDAIQCCLNALRVIGYGIGDEDIERMMSAWREE